MTSVLPLPPIQAYRPATYRERGVAVPFTTPLLVGARVRQGDRGSVELVVPNPSGGRGVYIVPCTSIRSLCRMTVHDSRLNQLLSGLPALTLSAVRRASLDVAVQGLAGRQAMAAAKAAIEKDQHDQALTKYLLLGTLAEQADPAAFQGADWRSQRSAGLEQQARRIVAQFAMSRHQPPEELTGAIEILAATFVPIGTAGRQWTEARLPRLLKDVTELHAALLERMREPCDDPLYELADMVASQAGPTVEAAQRMVAGLQQLTQDVVGLLRTWSKSPERLAELAARPEWLLDGWEQVCLLWRTCPRPDHQRAILTEMAHIVPVPPWEATEWCGSPVAAGDPETADRVRFNQDWRAGPALLDLTARNERLRSLAL